MVIAAISLAGVFVSTYLLMYKLGYIAGLACGTGACEVVNTSKWSVLFGIPVAAWGLAYYGTMFGTATVGSFGPLADSRCVGLMLVALSGWGVLFSVWLTYLELAEIHAICRYCVVSALLVFTLFVLSVIEFRAQGRAAEAESEG